MRILHHKFVEFIPEKVEEGVLYVSIEYCTAIHKCGCGCGNEVVTPLSPKNWKLIFNGNTVTLHPSIGNWNFECQSHYWIKNNRIEFASSWSDREINLGREKDLKQKVEYYDVQDTSKEEFVVQEIPKPTILQNILNLFRF